MSCYKCPQPCYKPCCPSCRPCYEPGPPTYYAPVSSMPKNRSNLRVVHNVAGGKPVDGYLDGNKVLGNFPYKRISDYLEVNAGSREAVVRVAETDRELIRGTIPLESGKYYTLIANGHFTTSTSIEPLLLVDDLSCPPKGKIKVRFVHATNGAPAVDIYVGSTKIFDNVSYGHVSKPEYVLLDAGEINVNVMPAGGTTKILGPVPYKLSNGGVYTIIASGILGDKSTPLTVIVSEDSKGSCVVMNI